MLVAAHHIYVQPQGVNGVLLDLPLLSGIHKLFKIIARTG